MATNNNVLFRRGDQTFIDENVPLADGQIIFNKTDQAIYVDSESDGTVTRARYAGGNLSRSDIDMTLSTTSENPVANKVITNAIGNLPSLQTDVKTNLVGAINEVNTHADTAQSAITAEATARQTADNTLQGNINSEAATRASADSNLQSQINQIIAPSGEAPSAAEVQNARIGADGVTYDTLGNAIRGQVVNLKSVIDDITETIQSTNIFDQANSTITEGKYLNYTNGNEGTNASYCYVNEYIPVEENTQYYGTTWNKSTGTLFRDYVGFAVFYDANKGYLGGLSGALTQNPFTTPAGCAYMRISTGISEYNSNNYMFEKGASASSHFIPYSVTHKLKLPLSIVDINGNGDFTSIASAVNTLPDGSAILVMPGTYVENVKAWTKEIHIIGFDREACVLKDTSGNYSTPPLEIGAGSVQNMTIIEQAEGAGTENLGAYAIHVESNNLYNKKLLIRNCYIESDSSSAIGMGLRGGCSVRIEDCEIICAGARASTGAAPIYFHDADASAYWGTVNLYLKNNVLRNTSSSLFSMLTINSIHKENTTYMHVMYNIFVQSSTPSIPQKFNTWNTSGNTDADGWNGLSHMYLTDDSFGNNQSELNYSA